MKFIYKVTAKLIPIMLGYFPVGISFAIIAAEFGLSNAEIISMSVFVLGAASQIAAILQTDIIDRWVSCAESDAFSSRAWLLRKHGIFAVRLQEQTYMLPAIF